MEFGVNGESSNTRCPKISDFINEILPQLEIMAVEPEQAATPGTNLKSSIQFELEIIRINPYAD